MNTQLKSFSSLSYVVLLALVTLLTNCKTFDDTAEKKSAENETAIQKYIADNKITVQKTASGLYYSVKNVNPAAQKALIGNEITLHFVMSVLDGSSKGSVIDSTNRPKNEPYIFQYGINRLIEGIEEGISLMRTGDQATFLIPHTLAYGGQTDAGLPAYSALVVTATLVNIRTEDQQIDDFIKVKKLTAPEITASGLRFIKTTTATGAALTAGQVVKVKYVGKFLNDKQFDAGEFSVTVGGGRVIKGFDEGVAKLKIGEKATLVFPSTLGYGGTGSGSIPPLTPLTFDIEILP